MKHLPPDSRNWKQLDVLPSQQPIEEPITPEIIARIKRKTTFGAAWNMAQDHAGLENKFVAGELGMDESHWNKIRKGIFFPPSDQRFGRYRKIVANHILLAWHCESEGFDFLSMRQHRNSLERENEELRQELADHKRALKLVLSGGGRV